MKKYSVLLVEDQPTTRERLKRVVEEHPNLFIIADVSTCTEAREELSKRLPDVLLIDLGLPDGDGIDIIRQVSNENTKTEIMVITVFADERHVVAAIEAGASGYLLKDGGSDYIGESIMQMLSGGSPISASIARYLLRQFRQSTNTRNTCNDNKTLPRLTAREKEVLELVAKGFSYNEIASALGMSGHTVTTHIKHIYKKLAVRSRGEAVFEAMQLGILSVKRSDR